MSNTFTLTISTPEKEFGRFEVSSLICPGLDGEICILKDHMPMLLAVDEGTLRFRTDDGWQSVVCDRGICEVNRNTVTLFADHCFADKDAESLQAQIAGQKTKDEEHVRNHRRHEIKLLRMTADKTTLT